MRRPTVGQRSIRLVAALAVLAGPTLRVAMDAGEHHGADHVERSHDAGRCRVLHDHRACLLLYASAAAPAARGPTLPPAAAPFGPVGVPTGRGGGPAPSGTDLPRAPPSPFV